MNKLHLSDGIDTWLDQSRPRSFSPIGWPMTQSSPGTAISGHAQSLAEVVPGYSAKTADEDTNQSTPPSVLSQGDIDSPDSGQETSSIESGKECACIVCLEIGILDVDIPYHCHFAGCNYNGDPTTSWWRNMEKRDRAGHARSHYRQIRGPKDPLSPFYCPVEKCNFSSKRWPDLQRHTTAKHCSNPAKFSCSVIGCKYSGEGNGFTRKDKLTAHKRSMHQGQRSNGQAVRTLQAAPASSHPEASGSGGIPI